MNIIKLQNDLLKLALSDKGKEWMIEKNEARKEIYVGDGHCAYIIESDKFILDYDKLLSMGVRNVTMLKRIFDVDSKNVKNLTKTGVKREIGKVVAVQLKLDENTNVYCNEKLLKYFNKELEFDGTDPKSPVFVYEEGEMVGLVLPIKVVE